GRGAGGRRPPWPLRGRPSPPRLGDRPAFQELEPVVLGVPTGGVGSSGAPRVSEHLADGRGLRESSHSGERDGELRMALSLAEETGGRVQERDVAGGDEGGTEHLPERVVGAVGCGPGDLPDRPDRERAV